MGGMMPQQVGQGAHGMLLNPYQMGGAAMPPDMHSQATDSEYVHRSSVLGEPGGSAISATAFDSQEELVWLGTRTVSVH